MKIQKLILGLECQMFDLSLIPSSVADLQGYLRQIPRLLYVCASYFPASPSWLSLFLTLLCCVNTAQWASGLSAR